MIVRYTQVWDEEREEWVHRYDALCHKSGKRGKLSTGKIRYKIISAVTTKRDDKLAAQFIRDQLRAIRREERMIQPLPIPDPERYQNIEIG